MDDLKKIMDGKPNPNILRTLNADFSVRKGKYGPYVFYKTTNMKKPKFLDIKQFNQGYSTCSINDLVEWLCKTHKIENTYI